MDKRLKLVLIKIRRMLDTYHSIYTILPLYMILDDIENNNCDTETLELIYQLACYYQQLNHRPCMNNIDLSQLITVSLHCAVEAILNQTEDNISQAELDVYLASTDDIRAIILDTPIY